MKTEKRDRKRQKRDTRDRDILARAWGSYGTLCHGVTRDSPRDVTVSGRDSDTPPGGRVVTITPSTEQRFAGWLAGASAEQVKAWQERNKKA